MLYELAPCCDTELVVRKGTVDRNSVEWMSDSLFLQALRDNRVAPGDTVLDLGAHIGSFSVVAAKGLRARVVGFEPDADSLRLARTNALLNGVADLAEFHPFAVGGPDRATFVFESTENWGHTIVEGGGPYNKLTGRKSEVRLISLQSALNYAPDGCAFMKFNIEGAEYEMFENARPDILRRIRAMAGEIHHDLGAGDIKECVAKLRQCGFAVQLVPQGEVRAILIATRA